MIDQLESLDYVSVDDVIETGAEQIIEQFGNYISHMVDAGQNLIKTNRCFTASVEKFRQNYGTDFVMSVLDMNEESLFEQYNNRVV